MGSDHRSRVGGARGLVAAPALVVALVLALPSSAGTANPQPVPTAATQKVKVRVSLPADGRQTFAVAKVEAKAEERPGKVKDVKVTNAAEIPDDVRAGAATAGPFKKRGDRWEYVILVAVNDLGSGIPARRGERNFIELAVKILLSGETASIPPYMPAPCPDKLERQREVLKRFLAYWAINAALGFPSTDEEVMENAIRDSEANPNC